MDVAALVTLASNTLVAAAVTDAWETTRHGFARLFGRGKPDLATERRLDDTQQRLAIAGPADLDHVRADLAGRWATRLTDLLDDYPPAEAELRALVDEIRNTLPAGTLVVSGHSVAASGDMRIEADRGSVAAGVIHGNVGPPGPILPSPASR